MIMIMMLSCRLRGLQKSSSASIGYAMMMSSNKAKTAVHGCLMLARGTLVVRRRAVKATPGGWCKVCLPCLKPFPIITIMIVNNKCLVMDADGRTTRTTNRETERRKRKGTSFSV